MPNAIGVEFNRLIRAVINPAEWIPGTFHFAAFAARVENPLGKSLTGLVANLESTTADAGAPGNLHLIVLEGVEAEIVGSITFTDSFRRAMVDFRGDSINDHIQISERFFSPLQLRYGQQYVIGALAESFGAPLSPITITLTALGFENTDPEQRVRFR